MSNFLKEAIADAKELRKAGYENAKQKLHETFKDQMMNKFNHTINEMESEEDDELNEMFDFGLDEADDEEGDAPEEAPTEDEGDADPMGGDDADSMGDTGDDADPMGGDDATGKIVGDMTQEELIALIQSTVTGAMSMDSNTDGQPDVSQQTDLTTGDEDVQAPMGAGDSSEVDELDELELDELLAEDFEDEDEDESMDEAKPTGKVPNDPNAAKLHEQLKKANRLVSDLKKANKVYKNVITEHTIAETKLQYLNKIYAENTLTKENKVMIAERMDAATSKDQARFIYEAVNQTLKPLKNTKGKKSMTEGVVRRSNPTVGPKVGGSQSDSSWDRMLELAKPRDQRK